ncbi:hypothetical protein DCAR_0415844 [Daucus carota subsp. sativus]|uniref:Uncharacterized protein n=1 Tax=Daucus carota subsp. sativus TaxID=79200 RepID=A0A165WTV6_DAUCS|nr:hypothetical protein DCAR_0415844 [Daucus carota subsp. sativus]
MHAWLPACHLQNPSSEVDGVWRMACEEPCMPLFYFLLDSAHCSVNVCYSWLMFLCF